VTDDIQSNEVYRVRLANRDSSGSIKASMKLVITEHYNGKGLSRSHESSILPRNFDEVKRVKPKVQGLKESSFI